MLCEEDSSSIGNIYLRKSGGRIFMGLHSYVNAGGYISSKTFIGRYCSIGRRVSIGAGMHSIYGLSTSASIKGVESGWYTNNEIMTILGRVPRRKHAYTILENDIWVGDGAVIVEGVRIGTGSIIPANSVVTRDVMPYEIFRPGKEIVPSYRFSSGYVEKLLASRWWNLSQECLKKMPTHNIVHYLNAFDGLDIASSTDFKQTFGLI